MLGLCAVGVLLGNSHHFHGVGTTVGVHVVATGQDDVITRLGDALLHQQRKGLSLSSVAVIFEVSKGSETTPRYMAIRRWAIGL